ncbi:MAG: hypothetical protein M0D57_13965 [Sphingobacteriales bacterium JAD_PAG50586_3]|nr:MAG: hypothetical protein M0D57_13965 [Sphingobacteriales bacterium JAD_PAG50586_3]
MKTTAILFMASALGLVACGLPDTKVGQSNHQDTVPVNKVMPSIRADSLKTETTTLFIDTIRPKLDSLQIVKHAQGIINGTVQPSDDDITFAVLDSVCSQNAKTRAYYFKALKKTLVLSDGALSEMMGVFIKCYIETAPGEAAKNYALLTPKEQQLFTFFLAFELMVDYPSTENEPDVSLYFNKIRKRISPIDNEALKSFVILKKETIEGLKKLIREN